MGIIQKITINFPVQIYISNLNEQIKRQCKNGKVSETLLGCPTNESYLVFLEKILSSANMRAFPCPNDQLSNVRQFFFAKTEKEPGKKNVFNVPYFFQIFSVARFEIYIYEDSTKKL